MILDDLRRPPLIHRLAWYALGVVTVASLILAGWTAYENHKLVHTNSLLARMVDEKLDSIAMTRVLTIVRSLDERILEALQDSGARGVYGALRRVE